MFNIKFVSVGITLLALLSACQSSTTPLESADIEEGVTLEQQTLTTLTSAQKQQLRAHSRKVYYAGTGLFAMSASTPYTTLELAPILQKACLKGADQLMVKGQIVPLKNLSDGQGHTYDLSFPAVPTTVNAIVCRVVPHDQYWLSVSLIALGSRPTWIVTNGEYPLNDPENLTDVEQKRNGQIRSRSVYQAIMATWFSEVNLNLNEVVSAFQPMCLKGFSTIKIAGVVFSDFGLPTPPIGLSSCTITMVGTEDIQVAITTVNGFSYVTGPQL